MQPLDPRTGATTHFLLLYALLEKAQKTIQASSRGSRETIVGKPVRSRAREAPGLLLSAGPLGLLTFYASKISDKNLYNKLATEFFNLSPDVTLNAAKEKAEQIYKNTNAKTIDDELSSGGKGYTILLAMITAYLANQDNQNLLREPSLEGLIDFLKDLAKTPELEAQIQDLLLPYLTHLKQLVEAVVKEDE
ncbi:MAG: type III-B CRISPR module-associated protein Cmr5 [Desulfurococcales archaeon]|nr:type III-B CRISPR module-associated protein Cmr5 [Desulfurococcales archaeon]